MEVFLLSVKTGSVGLNLTRANHVFMLEPCLNPALELQAIGRVHRIGQTKEVFIKYLVMESTVEERMMLLNKDNMKSLEASTSSSSSSSSRTPTRNTKSLAASDLSFLFRDA